jgi:hypothetical protein
MSDELPELPEHLREEVKLVLDLGDRVGEVVPGSSLLVTDEGDTLSFRIGVAYSSTLRKSKVELMLMADRDGYLNSMARDMAVAMKNHILNELEGS